MATWSVASYHMRPDQAAELSRMQERFRSTYMLLEVDGLDGKPQAFAVVPFADEAALMALFQGQTTPLHFTTADTWPSSSDEEPRRKKISVLDWGPGTGKRQVVDLCQYDKDAYKTFVTLPFLEKPQYVHFVALFEESSAGGGGGAAGATNGGHYLSPFTVKLRVEVAKKRDNIKIEQSFDTILKLYKFLEIVLTAAGDWA